MVDTLDAPVSNETAPQSGLSFVPSLPRVHETPAWYVQRVNEAWENYEALPFPDRRSEPWRYSSSLKFNLSEAQLATPANEDQKAEAIAQSQSFKEAIARLVFVNDELVYASTEALAQGVLCLSFEQALQSHADVLEKHLMKRKVELGSEKYAALHLALVKAGAVIVVPANVKLEHPIEIFHWVTGEQSFVLPHTLIVAGAYSRVTVLDHHASLNEADCHYSLAVADLVAAEGAHVTYVNLQEFSERSAALHISSTTVGKSAEVKALQLQLGAAFARSESVSDLIGEEGRSYMYGVSLPHGDQFVDMRTLQNHEAPHTYSDLIYKNALYDQSKTVFSGLIQVAEGAHFTDAYQKCRNLLNSESSEAVSMPGLEINADQVKCSHGATSAPISDDELFYLKARGIPEQESRQLITLGFLQDAIAHVGEEPLAAFLQERVEAKFASL